jgi:hypothetical protein
MNQRIRAILLTVVLLVSGFLGVMVAIAFSPSEENSAALVQRVRNGVTETGRIETVTTDGVVKRVIHWRTRSGELQTQTVEGPARLVSVYGTTTLPGGSVVVTGPVVTAVETVHDTITQTLPGETVTETLPGETVTQTLPGETVIVTETLPGETVTVTSPAP